MRLINAVLGLMFVVFGLLFAALNRNVVQIDLGVITLDASLGVALLVALLIGVLLGGVVALIGSIWPRRKPAVSPQANADV